MTYPTKSTPTRNIRRAPLACGLAIVALGLSAWIPSAYAVDFVAATGGTVTTYNAGGTIYNVHTFTGSGTFTVTNTSGGTVNYLVVGGGGGGGGSTGGGGGAGGFLTGTTTVTGGNTAYAVTVGTGGAGGTGNGNPAGWGSNGGNSVFGSFATAVGGGGGAPNAASGSPAGNAGGSGGGASWGTAGGTGGAATSGQGNAGGACLAWGGPYAPGGGGGAGSVGTAGNMQSSGAPGGAGLSSTIQNNVTTKWYAAGGGGGNYNNSGAAGGSGIGGTGGGSSVAATSGAANTGSGGGGQGQNRGGTAGSGGSGIVIISYASGTSPNPTSTSATLAVSENVATALAASNFDYYDPNASPLAEVQITSLPTLGTLMHNGNPVVIGDLPLTVAAADIGNLSYKSAVPTYGTGAAYTTIGIKVQNSNSLWSDPAVMTVNLTPALPVLNGSFEITTADSDPWTNGSWMYIPKPWTANMGPYGRIKYTSASVPACPGGGTWIANMTDAGGDVLTQDLHTTVNAGDALSVTFYVIRDTTGGGVLRASFLVGATTYSKDINPSDLTLNTWVPVTFNQTIGTGVSGNLSLKFTEVSGRAGWLDNVSNVSVTSTTYTVIYNANSASSGTAPTDSGSPYSAGATVTVKSNSGTLARTGYAFGGWNTATDGSGTHYDATGSATFGMPANNVTLDAEWTGTVTYDSNNANYGAVPTDATAYKQSQSATAASNSGDLARTGYTFVGWNTANDGSGTSYTAGSGSIPMADGNVTLYAKWTTLPPTITLTGALSEVNTTYGTASVSPTSFTVSGANMVSGIAVTPPPGFEVSQTPGGDSGYAGSGTAITVGSAGTIADTTVYVRLTATATVGSSPYSGVVTCTSSGATQMDVATGSSTVSPAELTITANNQDKVYGTTQTTPVTGSTAFTSTGLKNGDTVGTVTLTYETGGLLATDPAGNTSTITPSNAAGGTFAAGNYNVSYAAGTLTVGKATPTATLVVNNSPVTYDGSAHAATVGITASSVPGEVLNILTGGAATQTAAGTYAVTADFVPTDTANYNTLANKAAGNFIINTRPTSPGGSVTVRIDTPKAFAATDFPFADADAGNTLKAIKVTSLPDPAKGTLKLGGAAITAVPSDPILVANIGTLTYTPTTGFLGDDSFNFQVSDGNVFSADATMAISVKNVILVQNGSFETRGSGPIATYWWGLGSPWTEGSIPQGYEVLDMRGWEGATFSSAADGFYAANLEPWVASITQNLNTTVHEGDILSMTFSGGRAKGQAGGKFTATFVVGTTEYTSSEFDTALQANNTWQQYTFGAPITNTGNLSIVFKPVSGRPWLDNISNVSVTTVPTAGSYASWALANGATSDPLADSNNNGVANGIEFFMGGTLASPATLPPLVDNEDTWTWTIPYDPNAAASYRFDVSPDLRSWTHLLPGDPAITPLTGPDAIRLTLPAGMKFCRLVVTPN